MIAFIGCVKTKREHPCTAIELYRSDLFCKSVAYAEARQAKAIYILSAKYGLVPAWKVIAPYDETLNAKSEKEKRQWADMVIEQADKEGIRRDEAIMLLGGENYAKYLRAAYKNAYEPLRGLQMGKRLRFLKNNAPRD